MNINASIIDQRLLALADTLRERAETDLHIRDEARLLSLAFVYLCVSTVLDLDFEDSFDCLTEGGGDFGVDALHCSEEIDGEFVITLFQAKYTRDLRGNRNYPANAINSLVRAIRVLFDPASSLGASNHRLDIKVEACRAMIRDGYIPRVRVVACNNGLRWAADGQAEIDRAQADFGSQVTWEHVNHDALVGIMQRVKSVDETLRLTGKAVVEDMNYSRVCIGRVPVEEIARIMKAHGDSLLERNIRRYLGLHGNRVNEGIRATLHSDSPDNFYFFNNGLTLVCSDFSYNALQNSDYQIKLENLQIVNGGQTCMTIFRTIEEMERLGQSPPTSASVLVRIYKLPRDNDDIVLQITHATNSQNPVDLKDLRSNDDRQRQLEADIAGLGFSYRRKRTETSPKPTDITSGAAAEAILAVWRHAPHQAKFLTREHFGKLYDQIFSDRLNGAQTVVAVLLYRIAENRRRRPSADDPVFVPYASCFLAMQMGRRLLRDLGVDLHGLTHQKFDDAQQLIDTKGGEYFQESLADVTDALKQLYGEREVSLQQLSATFRRGDLIQNLLGMDL